MPFCPECKYEYRPEISFCPDCDVKLVDRLQDNDASGSLTNEKLVVIYETPDESDAQLNKSNLESRGFEVWIQPEQPLSTLGVFMPDQQSYRLFIIESKAEAALKTLNSIDHVR